MELRVLLLLCYYIIIIILSLALNLQHLVKVCYMLNIGLNENECGNE